MVGRGVTPTSPVVRAVLSEALAAGDGLTSLPVEPLEGALRAGHRLVLPTGQVTTVSGDAPRSSTAVPVEQVVPTAAVAAGSALAQEVVIAVADGTWSGGYLFLRNIRDDVAEISCSSLTVAEPGGRS